MFQCASKNILRFKFKELAGLAVFLIAITALPGCQHFCWVGVAGIGGQEVEAIPTVQKFSSFVSPRFTAQPPRRVVIVPTGNSSGRFNAPKKFSSALAAEIRMGGIFEVVEPQHVQCKSTVDGILAGRFDEREMVELARTYSCDAVMFVRVNQLQGHWPLKASVTAAMVDANEAVVVFAIDGNWNTADRDIRGSYERFVDARTGDESHSAKRIHLKSPTNLMAFVAHQMTDVMRNGIE